MENVTKYFLVLEELSFQNIQEETPQSASNGFQKLDRNVHIVEKYLKMDLGALVEELSKDLNFQEKLLIDKLPNQQIYFVLAMEYILLKLTQKINFESDAREDLIANKHINKCIESIQTISPLALRYFLHSSFKSAPFYANDKYCAVAENKELLLLNINIFAKVLRVKKFHIATSMELVIQDFMCSLFTISQEETISSDKKKVIGEYLDWLWNDLLKMNYFRNVMIMRGMKMTPSLKRILHNELVKRLTSADGFNCLVTTMHLSKMQSLDVHENRINEIIANIVCHERHTHKFHQNIIQQIWTFIELCIKNEAAATFMGAGLLSLRRLYDLNDVNRLFIKESIARDLSVLVTPRDTLTGLILMEHKDFMLLLQRIFNLFGTSIVECLPSEILCEYLPLFLKIYNDLPNKFKEKQQVGLCLVRCLHNLSREHLKEIIDNLFRKEDEFKLSYLHPRIIIEPNEMQTEVCVKIASIEFHSEINISSTLPELLIASSFHLLTYRIFMILLELLIKYLNLFKNFEQKSSHTFIRDTNQLDFIQSEEELITFLELKYGYHLELLVALTSLLHDNHLTFQIRENHKDFLKFIADFFKKILNDSRVIEKVSETEEHIIYLLLSVMQEIWEDVPIKEDYQYFIGILQKLKHIITNKTIQRNIQLVSNLLSGNFSREDKDCLSDVTFNEARMLIESAAPYLQVYGIRMFIDLLKLKDTFTMNNKHRVLALAMTTLKDKESYTFLNTVRLCVALVYVLEDEVIECLSDKYLNEKEQLDHRLVVGEALIKVSQEIGPLCYKYKHLLLNTFMSGCRSHTDEFRMSAFSNLAQLCKTLSYEVHNYFQELLCLIDCELKTGHYLPCKRAAVLVLVELLDGMGSLLDFGEMLKPIYQILRVIESSENSDTVMKLHASKGLLILAEKCQTFLFPKYNMEKEIKIFGIGDKPTQNKSNKSILELD